jgi:hypothetical protein
MTSFMAHPEILLPLPDIEDPVQRFVGVTKFYLSGWHIKPPYAVHTSKHSGRTVADNLTEASRSH